MAASLAEYCPANSQQKMLAVGLYDNLSSACYKAYQEVGHGQLRVRMEMDFRFLHKKDRARTGAETFDDHWECLTNSKPDIRQICPATGIAISNPDFEDTRSFRQTAER